MQLILFLSYCNISCTGSQNRNPGFSLSARSPESQIQIWGKRFSASQLEKWDRVGGESEVYY